MGFLKRDHAELLIGVGLLALGLGLLLFTFSQALTIASAPADFFRSQFPPQEQAPTGPAATFRWDTSGFNVTVQDTSRQGDAAITSWDWNFGDGTRVSGQNPGPHAYANPSVYQVSLIVRDGNGKESRALAQVEAAPMQTRSGESVGDPTAGLAGFDLSKIFDLSGILQPAAIIFLTFAMYVILTRVGGEVTRAGWNIIKPKPETIRIRIKPKHLEAEPVYLPTDVPPGAVQAPPPPPA